MLFNMLILGSLIDESGYIFHRSETDLYIVETTLPNDKDQVRIISAVINIMDKNTISKIVHLLQKSKCLRIHFLHNISCIVFVNLGLYIFTCKGTLKGTLKLNTTCKQQYSVLIFFSMYHYKGACNLCSLLTLIVYMYLNFMVDTYSYIVLVVLPVFWVSL